MDLDNASLFSQIDILTRMYDSGSLSGEVRISFEREMRLRLSWNTNHLEGNTLSLDETIDVIEYDEVRSGHTYGEYTEAKRAFRAFSELLDLSGLMKVDLDYIKKANEIIMGSDGSYRTGRVYIGTLAEASFIPPAPEKIPELMTDFSRRLEPSYVVNDVRDEICYISKLHLDFERIHPFSDGNGRTGRLFMDQMLLNAGLLPPIIENNSRYRQAFRIYDRTGDTSLMEHCVASGIIRSYDVLEDNIGALGS